MQFSYDGFGNRTNQTVTKGSGPTHSVAIDGATNRISTGGYLYDSNGNMTQMPQLTMGYDVANRMVTSNHAGAGTQSYGYNHANQRVFVRSGSTVTYYLYGLGGERLLEFAESCTGGACTGYVETQRWIYFAGRKMFSKTGSTLKAVTPNRLASEAKHFPYGETDGTPPDTKDYFATYRRDATELDYAWNRYYSPTMGRFTTADPYGGSVNPGDPGSWNRYGYAGGDPVNYWDRNGALPERIVFDEGPNGDTSQYYVPMAGFFLSSWLRTYPPAPEYSGFNLQDYYLSRADCFEAAGNRLSDTQESVLGTKEWSGLTTTQRAAFLNFTAAAADAGVDLSGFTLRSITADRMFVDGPTDSVRRTVSFLKSSAVFVSNTEDPLVGTPHSGSTDSFRQATAMWSLQVNAGESSVAATGFLEIDIDRYNPAFGLGPLLGHGFAEVIPHALHRRGLKFFEGQTSPFNVARGLRGRGVDLGHDCD